MPYKTTRSQKTKTKWVTNRLKQYIRQKRSNYQRLKVGEEDLRPQYNKLTRTSKRFMRKAKSKCEIK